MDVPLFEWIKLWLSHSFQVQPGDCIVCFSRKAIYNVTKSLEKLGVKPAVIYGDLPPGTKLAQAAKFNDPEDPCNVLVRKEMLIVIRLVVVDVNYALFIKW